MTTSTTMANDQTSRRYYASHPVYTPKQIPFFVEVLTESIIWNDGDLSTALWEVNDNFLDYGYYQLVVTFDLRS